MAEAMTSTVTKDDLREILNERQQISYDELSELAMSRGVPEPKLREWLTELEKSHDIASRSSGGILTYYILQGPGEIRKVLIVEDDKNINKLMALSIGKGYEITQVYDGGDAISAARSGKPDLVMLDLMLPHKDGLDICETIKKDPQLSNTVVILISAMDPTSNRFKGIKYGADYYIKKPFDPNELKSLVTLFLKKKGKRFDPLVDLPDEERISNQIEHSIKQKDGYVIGTLKIDGLGLYAKRFGERQAVVLLRLVSQLLQDAIKTQMPSSFVGFLNSDEFVVAGTNTNVDAVVKEVQSEFNAVLRFVLQDAGLKQINLDIPALVESDELPKLALVFTETPKDQLKQRRNEVLKNKGVSPAGGAPTIGAYTYEELQKMFGKDNLDITITRDNTGVRIQVSKDGGRGKEDEDGK